MHAALDAMVERPQWICWRPIDRGDGKVDKVPTDPHNAGDINPHISTWWMTAKDARRVAREKGLGVGFVFTEADPFFFLDIDGCIDDAGDLSALARALLSNLPGAAVETSISRRGLHVFGRCSGALEHASKNVAGHIELYTDLRFVAIGSALEPDGWALGSSGTDCTDAVQRIVDAYFPPAEFDDVAWSDAPVDEYRSTLDDDAIIAAASKQTTSRQAFGFQASFAQLFAADTDALASVFPSDSIVQPYDASSADLALASLLAFWTGKDCERIERIMRRSELVRPKWERVDYLRRTIVRAVSSYFGQVLGEREDKVEPPTAAQPLSTTTPIEAFDETPRDGRMMLFPPEQRDYFEGCIALPAMSRVYVPGHGVIKADGFKMIYDGPSFVLSNEQGAKSTRNSWAAWTGNETNPTPWAHGLTFKPGRPQLVMSGGERKVNLWRPLHIERKAGDPSPFVDHVRRMLPKGDDAQILLAYLAAVVQYPGQKFPWCPVLQGVQGNGKSTIARCVELAVGEPYVHQGSAKQLTAQFNSWMSGSILVIIDDIKISRRRVDAMERIKPVITQARLSVEPKGVDASTRDVCCNFLLNTNHKDALPLTADERRFAVFYCAQQKAADLDRDGMSAVYFAELRRWLEQADGYAIVADYLHTLDIPAQWNPSNDGMCGRAPATTSSAEAVYESLPEEAQHIEAAIDEAARGFRDGWVSSIQARNLFEQRRVNVAPRQLGRLMELLGYVRHPALAAGRTSTIVFEEQGRPRLYLRAGHVALNAQAPAEVVRLYAAAQGYATAGAAKAAG